MPYQNDPRPPVIPMPQHPSVRRPNDRPGGGGMPRPSPPHSHGHHHPQQPSMNPPPPFNRHEYHHPHQPPHPPRHPRNIPPHFNERSPRTYPPFGPHHGMVAPPHPQSDEHVQQQQPQQYQLPPSQSPRSNPAPPGGPEGIPHIRAPPPPPLNHHRRNPPYPYGQGMYEYGEYNNSNNNNHNRSMASPESSHSPPIMRPPPMRENDLRRFTPRPTTMDMHGGGGARHRNGMGSMEQPQPQPHPNSRRNEGGWHVRDSYEKEYPSSSSSSNHQEETILPPPQMQRNTPYSMDDRVFCGPPRGTFPCFDRHHDRRHNNNNMPYEHSLSNSENNSDDEKVLRPIPRPRSNDEEDPDRDELYANPIGCTCKKSKCLKLYCQCFASNIMCSASCRCLVCQNTPKFENARKEARRIILLRNPNAFDTKFKSTTAAAEGGGVSSKKTHKLGCKCRKSACLKKYCECYNANVKCSSNCRCVGCQNMPDHDRPGGGGGGGGGGTAASESRGFVVPDSMMTAARDLAGLRSGGGGGGGGSTTEKIASMESRNEGQDLRPQPKIQSPPRATVVHQDLYPVPVLTASDTRSKEDDLSSDGQQQQAQQQQQQVREKQTYPNEISPMKSSSSTKPSSSSVDVLLSAAYALTELQSSISSPAKTSLESNNSNLISPSPKRKLSELSFQASSNNSNQPKRNQPIATTPSVPNTSGYIQDKRIDSSQYQDAGRIQQSQ